MYEMDGRHKAGRAKRAIFIPSIGRVIWKGNFHLKRQLPTSPYLSEFRLQE